MKSDLSMSVIITYGSIILKIVLWAHFSITHAVLIGSSDFLKNPYFRTGYCATAYVLSVHSLVWIPKLWQILEEVHKGGYMPFLFLVRSTLANNALWRKQLN